MYRKMNKKGISPLIATVLLIGFTVALAAVVMTWGGAFIKKQTETTGTTAESTIACANLNLKATYGPATTECNNYVITVSNTKNVAINGISVRKFNVDGELLEEIKKTGKTPAADGTTDDTIPAYGVKTYRVDVTGANKIQIMPQLSSGAWCPDSITERYITGTCTTSAT